MSEVQIAANVPSKNKFKLRIAWLFLLCYVVLFFLVVFLFDNVVIGEGLLFVVINGFVALAFFALIRTTANWSLYIVIYSAYFLSYIFKGVVQYVIGINTVRSMIALRTHVEIGDYIDSIVIVTVGHIAITTMLILFSLILGKRNYSLDNKRYLSDNTTRKLIYLSLLWVLVSSIVMYYFGVAVMGKDGVSLPYQLSGVLFYSRTILIPMMIIYFIEKSVIQGKIKLYRLSMILFMFLVISEIIVRASKAPLMIFVLQISFIYLFLLMNRSHIRIELNKKLVILAIIAAIILWPVISVYREIMVGSEVAAFVENSGIGYAAIMLDSIYYRLIGFMRLSGLVSDSDMQHEIGTLIEYGSIARYYTEYYLGYIIEGHSSSPSLLGAALILGGKHFWVIIVLGYILAVLAAWRLAFFFPHMGVSIVSMLVPSIFNTMMAGTIDSSIIYIVYVFLVAIVLELMFKGARNLS